MFNGQNADESTIVNEPNDQGLKDLAGNYSKQKQEKSFVVKLSEVIFSRKKVKNVNVTFVKKDL